MFYEKPFPNFAAPFNKERCSICKGKLRFMWKEYDVHGWKQAGYVCSKCHAEFEVSEVER